MLSDTTPDAQRVWLDLLRRATPAEKLARVRSLSATVIELSRRAIARRHPDWTPLDVGLKWVELHYGGELAEQLRQDLEQRAAHAPT